jgi:hypothetical protein
MKPLIDGLLARAQEQGDVRPDVVGFDVPMIQLMVAAVTDRTGHPDLWRRYLRLLLDGMRAEPGATSALPDVPPPPRRGLAGAYNDPA